MARAEVVLRDMRQIEVKVSVSKIFWLRFWALKTLLILAARVSGATVSIEKDGAQ